MRAPEKRGVGQGRTPRRYIEPCGQSTDLCARKMTGEPRRGAAGGGWGATRARAGPCRSAPPSAARRADVRRRLRKVGSGRDEPQLDRLLSAQAAADGDDAAQVNGARFREGEFRARGDLTVSPATARLGVGDDAAAQGRVAP